MMAANIGRNILHRTRTVQRTQRDNILDPAGLHGLPLGQLQDGSKWAPLGGGVEAGYRNSSPPRFGGGANEVQRDLIARRGLGLPRSR